MGYSSYDTGTRSLRATTAGYYTVTAANMSSFFPQMEERKAHEQMDPHGITVREARDSEAHPNTVPIILALDVTGSMGHIPRELLKDGLPKIVGGIIQNGVPDPALCFVAVGDHECDSAPLQVAQFESGDEELDMWLQRTYPEGGGGGNMGESYALVWYFAARHTVTDAWEKRGQKGILITIGDEPNLQNYPSNAMKEITGNGDIPTFTAAEIYTEASKKWEIFHINPHGNRGREQWKQLLGDNYIEISDYTKTPDKVKDIVCKVVGSCGTPQSAQPAQAETSSQEEEIKPKL